MVLHGTLGLPVRFESLVHLIRLQAELRILASLEVHTEDTLLLGRDLVEKFHHRSVVSAHGVLHGF